MRLPVFLVTVLAFSAACGGGDGNDGSPSSVPAPSTSEPSGTTLAPTTTVVAPTTTVTPTTAPTTTAAPEPVLFDSRGPWPVGIATLDLGDRQADVYYPAVVDPGAETEIFDSLSVFPEEFQAFIPDELTGLYDTGAHRDAVPASDQQYPVLAYSHGFGAFRQVASFHTCLLYTSDAADE